MSTWFSFLFSLSSVYSVFLFLLCVLVCFSPTVGSQVTGEVVIDKLLAYTLLLMVCEQVWDCYCSYCMHLYFLYICPSFVPFVLFFLPNSVSPYLEIFLWLKRRSFNLVLAFLNVRMEISWCSWELYLLFFSLFFSIFSPSMVFGASQYLGWVISSGLVTETQYTGLYPL